MTTDQKVAIARKLMRQGSAKYGAQSVSGLDAEAFQDRVCDPLGVTTTPNGVERFILRHKMPFSTPTQRRRTLEKLRTMARDLYLNHRFSIKHLCAEFDTTSSFVHSLLDLRASTRSGYGGVDRMRRNLHRGPSKDIKAVIRKALSQLA